MDHLVNPLANCSSVQEWNRLAAQVDAPISTQISSTVAPVPQRPVLELFPRAVLANAPTSLQMPITVAVAVLKWVYFLYLKALAYFI